MERALHPAPSRRRCRTPTPPLQESLLYEKTESVSAYCFSSYLLEISLLMGILPAFRKCPLIPCIISICNFPAAGTLHPQARLRKFLHSLGMRESVRCEGSFPLILNSEVELSFMEIH